MERTTITRGLTVEEVPASSTRLLLMAETTSGTYRYCTELDRDGALLLMTTLGSWLLEWDENDPTHLLVMHPEAELVSTRQRKGQTILTLQWTPAEDEA